MIGDKILDHFILGASPPAHCAARPSLDPASCRRPLRAASDLEQFNAIAQERGGKSSQLICDQSPRDTVSSIIDHAAIGRNRPIAENGIDSKGVERAYREKTVSSFSQRALFARREITNENAGRTCVRPAHFRSASSSDQGMSPATNFGMTGPPISAAKRRF
ncbi:MAG TPA: hypothetical protein VED87_04940, partial [Methylocystis sp.]|nr:hypothetical protein [Methylocystis sp.]